MVKTQAKAANTRQVINADKRLRSVADSFTNAILKGKKGERQKDKGKLLPFHLLPFAFYLQILI